MTTNDRGAGIALGSAHVHAGRRLLASPGPPPACPRLAHLAAEEIDGALDRRQQMVGARHAREAAPSRARGETDDTISPSPDAIPLWKKNFSSNNPCGVSTYLFVVTRLIVDSCMPMSSPTSRSDSGRRWGNPRSRNSR